MKKFRFYSLFVTLISSIGGYLIGFHCGVISGVLLFLKNVYPLSVFMEGVIVSILLAGGIAGALLGGLISDRLGRKKTLILTALIFLISNFLFLKMNSIHNLLFARALIGFAGGIVSAVVPVYISEMSAAEYRGSLVSMNHLAGSVGILAAYCVNLYYSKEADWVHMLTAGFIPGLIYLIGLFFISETPTWLTIHHKKKKAVNIMQKIHLRPQKKVTEPKKVKIESSWKNLFSETMLPPLMIGIVICLLQQFSGINTVIYYAPRIFQMSGFSSSSAAIFASIGIGVINVIMTAVSSRFLDTAGRKALLIIGLTGMTISLFIVGYSYFLNENLGVFAVISLMLYVAFFAVSLGPIAWVLISEIFPMGVRGRANGICTFFVYLADYIVSISFLSFVNVMGKGGTFLMYSGICFLGLFFVIKKIPETKGKTLEEIQKFWKSSFKQNPEV